MVKLSRSLNGLSAANSFEQWPAHAIDLAGVSGREVLPTEIERLFTFYIIDEV